MECGSMVSISSTPLFNEQRIFCSIPEGTSTDPLLIFTCSNIQLNKYNIVCDIDLDDTFNHKSDFLFEGSLSID